MKKSDRTEKITSMDARGFELVQDTGSELVFRKKFNWWAFILLSLFSYGIGGIIYLIVHFSKPRLYEKYKGGN
jgi:hypothetical protein